MCQLHTQISAVLNRHITALITSCTETKSPIDTPTHTNEHQWTSTLTDRLRLQLKATGSNKVTCISWQQHRRVRSSSMEGLHDDHSCLWEASTRGLFLLVTEHTSAFQPALLHGAFQMSFTITMMQHFSPENPFSSITISWYSFRILLGATAKNPGDLYQQVFATWFPSTPAARSRAPRRKRTRFAEEGRSAVTLPHTLDVIRHAGDTVMTPPPKNMALDKAYLLWYSAEYSGTTASEFSTDLKSHHGLFCEGKQRHDWRCSDACYQMPQLD